MPAKNLRSRAVVVIKIERVDHAGGAIELVKLRG